MAGHRPRCSSQRLRGLLPVVLARIRRRRYVCEVGRAQVGGRRGRRTSEGGRGYVGILAQDSDAGLLLEIRGAVVRDGRSVRRQGGVLLVGSGAVLGGCFEACEAMRYRRGRRRGLFRRIVVLSLRGHAAAGGTRGNPSKKCERPSWPPNSRRSREALAPAPEGCPDDYSREDPGPCLLARRLRGHRLHRRHPWRRRRERWSHVRSLPGWSCCLPDWRAPTSRDACAHVVGGSETRPGSAVVRHSDHGLTASVPPHWETARMRRKTQAHRVPARRCASAVWAERPR